MQVLGFASIDFSSTNQHWRSSTHDIMSSWLLLGCCTASLEYYKELLLNTSLC